MAENVDGNANRDLDRLLVGLRDAKACPGMEGRILRTIEDRAAATRASAWWQLRPLSVMTAALACMVGLIGVFVLTAHRPEHASLEDPSAHPQTVTATAAPREFAPRSVPSSRAQLPARTRTRKSAAKLDGKGNGDQQALMVESFPAPPLPLTEQERLLLRVAHHHDPADLALLDPTKQEMQIAAEHAQFEKFFASKTTPIPLEVKNDSDLR